VVLLGVGIFFAAGAGLGDFSLLAPAIYALALLTSVTALQRVLHVKNALREAAGV
jgi:CDP-diacylglycerol--glycerol-3-phosphate 3-phosphatidyltransferase